MEDPSTLLQLDEKANAAVASNTRDLTCLFETHLGCVAASVEEDAVLFAVPSWT